jgi:hypothetical protein
MEYSGTLSTFTFQKVGSNFKYFSNTNRDTKENTGNEFKLASRTSPNGLIPFDGELRIKGTYILSSPKRK